ncbi:MAG: family 1 glycosylhydrolase, partial [Verrucomicrobiota bacterium]
MMNIQSPKPTMPDGFVWGAATASYQIEGAWDSEGKGPSIWDAFCELPGKIWEGNTGKIACDHYHRFQEDIALMKQIGLQAYRFSVSWPRVMPDGTGKINERGFAFYDRLVDRLLEAGIAPWLTLFHWDYPLALYLRGGWLNPDSSKWFAEYAEAVTERLSDRVAHWMTLNEPQCIIGLGHYEPATHAPGEKLNLSAALQAGHHLLLAHGLAVQAIRAGARQPASIGWAPVGVGVAAATDAPADIEAARQMMFSTDLSPWSVFWNNAWWGDPVVLGQYPEDGLRLFGNDAPVVNPGDMEIIRQPIDFFGANLYNSQTYRAGADGRPEKVDRAPGYPHSLYNWKMTPEALYWGPRFLAERYKLPIVITENGLTC